MLVKTELSKISLQWETLPEPEAYVKQALATVGKQRATHGSLMHTIQVSSNQIFDYTRCITTKHVTSWRGLLRGIIPASNRNIEEMSQRWRAVTPCLI